jgi:hypothetical protein
MNKLWYIWAMKKYSVLKRMSYEFMNRHEGNLRISLSKKSEYEKATYSMISTT